MTNAGHVQINHKNTLRISEVERLLATSRKAHRTANAFLAICVDQYVQNLLTSAEARVTHDKKKRVKVEHLVVPELTPEIASALAAFQAGSAKHAAADAEIETTEAAVNADVVDDATVVAVETSVVAENTPSETAPAIAAAVEEPVAVAEPPAKKARAKKASTKAQ